MFSEIINTICVLVSVSLLFLGATTHKRVKEVEEKIDIVINEMNELDSDSDSDSYSNSHSDSDSYSNSHSDSDGIPKYENETLGFDPFIEKSSSLPDFKDGLNLKKNMSF